MTTVGTTWLVWRQERYEAPDDARRRAVAAYVERSDQAGRTLGARWLITTIDDEEADHAR